MEFFFDGEQQLADPEAESQRRPAEARPAAPASRPALRMDDSEQSPRALSALQQRSKTRRVQAYGLLLGGDLLAIFLGFAAGSFARYGNLHSMDWIRVAMAAVPLFIAGAMHRKAYSLETLASASKGIRRVAAALVGTFAVLFVVSYFLKAEQDVSRFSIGVGVVATLAIATTFRTIVSNRLRRTFGPLTATVVICDETFVEPIPGAVIVNAVAAGLRPEPRNPAMIHRLVQLLSGADRVVVVCRRELCPGWATMLKCAHVRGEILADDVQSVGAVAIGRMAGRTTLVVSAGPLSTQQRVVKRVFDLALTVPAVIFFGPLLAAVAIAIKLDSAGPVFFRQKRVGFGNKLFDVYKFRSMTVEQEDQLGTRSTGLSDDRVTRVGRFIRRTSLDELPQLFNVLNGTMSLVGPRPHAIGSFAGNLLFWDVDERYSHRHLSKPGITGLAQVRGFRGTAHRVEDLSQRLQSDLEYMSCWSIWADIMILLKTAGVIVHPNAY
ncbi:sugar transferase [Sphingomonas sp.]|uniref:sugar transferase n=1 Tax=Sphingomonas sp. TaxID=28214 RepID=UPI0025D73ED5|nr:sugar transferase [Sphingomonas sp.]MBV9528634.1 sugar transferase [Sphingomonas sp.]